MGMPAVMTQSGTGAVVWFADWTLSPFQVGCSLVMSGDGGTAVLEATFDRIDISGTGGGQGAVGLGIGTTAANAAWFTVIAATATTTPAIANFTTPVQAFRSSLITAASVTSVMTVKFVQAGWPT